MQEVALMNHVKWNISQEMSMGKVLFTIMIYDLYLPLPPHVQSRPFPF